MSDKKAKPEEEEKKEATPETPEGEEGAEAAPKKKLGKKKIIIIAAAAVLLLGGVSAALLLSGGDEPKEDAAKHEKDGKTAGEEGKAGEAHAAVDKEGHPILPAYTDLPNIVVNLSSSSGRAHFVNLKITLELANKEDAKLIEAEMPKIQDSLNTYLRDIRKEDLDGSAGTERLKIELQNRFDKVLGAGKVKDVLFKEIVVQ